MKRFRWSSLYPRSWRHQYGEEFEAMLEMSGVTPRMAIDILWCAFRTRLHEGAVTLATVGIWFLIAWLNLNAHEVQWTAGALLAGAFILTLQNPGRWLKVALQLFTAVPISSLYLYQVPGIHHKPLYETSVALIPSFVGSVAGLILSWAWPSDWRAVS